MRVPCAWFYRIFSTPVPYQATDGETTERYPGRKDIEGQVRFGKPFDIDGMPDHNQCATLVMLPEYEGGSITVMEIILKEGIYERDKLGKIYCTGFHWLGTDAPLGPVQIDKLMTGKDGRLIFCPR